MNIVDSLIILRSTHLMISHPIITGAIGLCALGCFILALGKICAVSAEWMLSKV